MYLKSLELQGFKSFANKIVLQFHNGITGVVGPNGSGKSNVSDAIRWVLGEQSAKQLRGGSMQDVIFAGTAVRRPMSYAYVAITLDNADHALPIDYEEVTVARRLYRSGESEYLINGTSVRMRDIQELFFDTGIGKEGYSLIGQGQVEKILNGKPEERRELFDEAAGIVKYKHRKMAAVKKLESEQANLVRVNDILSELGRQAGPLKQQSETAKIYLAKRDEMKLVDVNLFLLDNDRYEENLKNAQDKLDTARAEQERVNEELAGAKTRYEELDEKIQNLDSAMFSANEELSGIRLQRQEHAGGIDLAQDRIRALDASQEELSIRARRLKTEAAQRREQMEDSNRRRADLKEAVASGEQERDAAEDAVREMNAKIAELNGQIDSNKEQIIRILNERTDIQTGRQRASTMIEQISLREAELNSRELTLRSEERSQTQSQEDLDAKKQDAMRQTETLQERSDRLSRELDEVQRDFVDGSDRLAKMREAYQRESSRFDTLRAITERYEGYGGSIRRVMEQKDRVPGILGVVADLIQTSRQYELAVETALGGSIQNIVTADEQTAKRMIAFLKENRFGRATFLPLTAMKNSRELKERSVLGETGVVGLASEIVTCEERFRDLVRNLLGRTVVVENIDRAVEIARRYHYSLRLVTLDGELLSPGGSMTGGAFKNNSNLLGRRREIDDAKKKLAKMKTQLDELNAKVEEDHTKRNRLRDEIRAVSGLMQKNEFDLTSLDQKMHDLSGRMEETRTAREQIARERAKIASDRKLLESEQASSGADLQKSDASEREANQRIEALQAKLEDMTASLAASEESLAKTRVKLAGYAQEMNFISQNLARLEEEIQNRGREEEEIALKVKAGEAEKEEKLAKITELKELIAGTKQAEEELGARIAEMNADKEEKLTLRKSLFDRREELSG
ncbi:MAG TPA: chromosome segregation protein SMC, partial [Lachnospiraceae bacterium]|nr:chromosome segregation protein SMC [Lachnospiraceae bacterium]